MISLILKYMIFTIIYFAFVILYQRINKKAIEFKRLSIHLLTVYLLFLFYISIVSSYVGLSVNPYHQEYNLIPFKDLYNSISGFINNPLFGYNIIIIKNYMINAFINFIMLVPMGILLPIKFKNIKVNKIILIGLGLSITLEIIQLFIVKFRIFDIDDIIFNFIGLIFGYILLNLYNKKQLTI